MNPRSLYLELMKDSDQRGRLWDFRKQVDLNPNADIDALRIGHDAHEAFELGVMWALQAEDSDY